jgi:O-antigen ligase
MAREYWPGRYSEAFRSTQTGPLGLSLFRGTAVVLAASLGAGAFGFLLAQLGLKGFLVAGGGLGIVMAVLVVRERPLLLLIVFVASLQVIFRKALGPIDEEIAGGPPAIYLTSTDVLLLALYGFWLMNGTLWQELRAVLRRRVFLIPFLGGLAVVPSLVLVSNVNLAVAELVRMAFGFALFVYVSLRLRSRREIELVLGEASALTPRTLDDGVIPRPSGTTIHPVFLGALMGPIGLLALSLAINLRGRASVRRLWLAVVPMALLPLVLAQARSALIGVALGGLVLTLTALRRGRLSARIIGIAVILSGFLTIAFWSEVSQRLLDNLGTEQFNLEVQSRLQLNQVALDITRDHPILGVGLNNFQPAMDAYNIYGLLYPGFPVHNLYLLILAESGVLGLAGLLATFGVLLWLGLRLAWVPDRLLSAVGAGSVAMYVFFYAEEMLGFSLRQDLPRTLFWLVAGLSVASWNIASERVPRAA